ncbi:hypothetical protein E8E13_001771 [Curvularia kusanoi]|uniref:Uncharacterized protein n=1 Tax=Curvularia kusanoi TaxID=90978 RepID=A0A9P4TMZ8_CURKU|nr:hypothetical protein E8E13_001771 [Curvularia kusanoi]
MASPQESITTVNGRRCTRSRARTAAQSTSTPAAAPTTATASQSTTSTSAEKPPSTQQTAASPQLSQQLQPPPPPPPPSSLSLQSSADAPLPTSQAAISSAAGTSSVLVSLATTPLPAILQPSASTPEIANPSAPSQPNDPVSPSSQIAAAPSNPPARIAPTSSDTSITAAIDSSLPSSSLPSSTSPAVAQPVVTESTAITTPTSVAAVPEIIQSGLSSQLLSTSTSQARTAVAGFPTHDPLGIIAPERGSHSSGAEHSGDGHPSSHSGSGPNIGGIVGGAIGGVLGLALLGVLLFFCLRRRKARQGSWDEKTVESSGFASTLKAVPAGLFARLRNEKTGPLDNPYQRHQPRSSVGSVYSTTSSGRGRSISEPQGQAAAGGGFIRRMSSKKSERNVLRKKTSSVSSQAPFVGITEEPVRIDNIARYDAFADSAPEPPRNLRISNPDTLQQEPSPPQPAATPRVVRDPFASLIDEIDGAPDWLRDSNMTASSASNHRRTQSSVSALPSHPTSSIYSRDPFTDPSPVPPLPTQIPTSQQQQQQQQPPLNTYSAFPSTRDSNFTFFGEPGPSRPGTTVFAPAPAPVPGLPSNPGANRSATNLFNTRAMTPGPLTGGLPTSTSRLDRQSDPFDLDRPEVLSFKGIMSQMRDSIARTTTVRSRRTSSIGGWFGREASPAPTLNGSSARR